MKLLILSDYDEVLYELNLDDDQEIESGGDLADEIADLIEAHYDIK